MEQIGVLILVALFWLVQFIVRMLRSRVPPEQQQRPAEREGAGPPPPERMPLPERMPERFPRPERIPEHLPTPERVPLPERMPERFPGPARMPPAERVRRPRPAPDDEELFVRTPLVVPPAARPRRGRGRVVVDRPYAARERGSALGTHAELRRAIVLREILGPSRGMEEAAPPVRRGGGTAGAAGA